MSEGHTTQPRGQTLYVEDLEQNATAPRCSVPGCRCGRLLLAPNCHKDSPVFANYDPARRELVFVCAECGSLLGRVVAVARRDALTRALDRGTDGRAN